MVHPGILYLFWAMQGSWALLFNVSAHSPEASDDDAGASCFMNGYHFSKDFLVEDDDSTASKTSTKHSP